MKRIVSIIAIVLTLVMAMGTFSACTPENTTDDGNKVTVSWYQGGKLLKEEKVDKGSTVSSWNPPAVEGKDFTGWFAEASLTQEFDFTKPVNEDTDIFAKYTSNVFVADDKSYYLIGTGSGDMSHHQKTARVNNRTFPVSCCEDLHFSN